MNGPSRSIEAIVNQIIFSKPKKIVIVEGPSDKFVILRWIKSEGGDYAIYCVDEIESIDFQEFRQYGENKAKIIAILRDAKLADFVGAKIVGLVDLDVDGIARPKIENGGIVYTDFTSLFAWFFDYAGLHNFIELVSGKSPRGEVISQIYYIGEFLYYLFAEKERLGGGVSLVDPRKYIASLESGGFDEKRYLSVAVGAGLHRLASEAELQAAVDRFRERGQRFDKRLRFDLHDLMSVISDVLYRERIIRRRIDRDEMYTLLRMFTADKRMTGSKCWDSIIS